MSNYLDNDGLGDVDAVPTTLLQSVVDDAQMLNSYYRQRQHADALAYANELLITLAKIQYSLEIIVEQK